MIASSPAKWLLAVLLAVAACTKYEIQSDRDPAVDFSRYRTFAWMPRAAAPPADQDTGDNAMDNQIYSFVEAQLERRGLTPAPSATADLLVTFRLIRNEGYDETNMPYGLGWRGMYRASFHTSGDLYVRGTLIVDVVDRKTNQLVWRGSAEGRLRPWTSYQEGVARAKDAVDKMFKDYPTG